MDAVFPEDVSSGFSSDRPDSGEVDYSSLVFRLMDKLSVIGCKLSLDIPGIRPLYSNAVEQLDILLLPYQDKEYIRDLYSMNEDFDVMEADLLEDRESKIEDYSSVSVDDVRNYVIFLKSQAKHRLLVLLSARKNFLPGRKVGLRADE